MPGFRKEKRQDTQKNDSSYRDIKRQFHPFDFKYPRQERRNPKGSHDNQEKSHDRWNGNVQGLIEQKGWKIQAKNLSFQKREPKGKNIKKLGKNYDNEQGARNSKC